MKIRTEEEYNKALEKLDELMDADDYIERIDADIHDNRLIELVDAIVAWEEENYPWVNEIIAEAYNNG